MEQYLYIEYHEHTSTTIYVRFKVKQTKSNKIKDSEIVIWTTTPWTIPGNRAVAFGAKIKYCLLSIKKVTEESIANENDKVVIAKDLIDDFVNENKIIDYKVVVFFNTPHI